MKMQASSDSFLFEEFRLDRLGGGLFRRDGQGAFAPVAIGSRALDILAALIERHGEIVSKEEIIAAVWPKTVVAENNLFVQISALRRVLDSEQSGQSCIQTVIGRGYRFAAPVTRHAGDSAISPTRVAVIGTRPLPPLSIVVLPFTNVSNDPDQEYFADGLTDDLTTDLSRIPDMFVIARNTAFTYRNKLIDAKQIGRELGIRYLLEGSVQRSDSEVRVNAQLIEAETNAHLWAERFYGDAGDLFALQNEITTRIAVALNQELPVAEAARRTERPDVLDYILRVRAIIANGRPGGPGAKTVTLLERALALDPHSAEAQSWLAYVLAGRVLSNMTDSAAVDIERAKALSEQAVAASPRSQLAHIAKGQVLRAQRRYTEATTEYETVLALDRNWVFAYFALGQCKLFTGSIEETIPLVEKAIRLSPHDSQLGVWYQMIGLVHLYQSHAEEAVMWLEKARNHTPAHS